MAGMFCEISGVSLSHHWEFPSWLFQIWLFPILTLRRPFALFCTLLRSFTFVLTFALFCACVCALLPSCACFCIRRRLEQPQLGISEPNRQHESPSWVEVVPKRGFSSLLLSPRRLLDFVADLKHSGQIRSILFGPKFGGGKESKNSLSFRAAMFLALRFAETHRDRHSDC